MFHYFEAPHKNLQKAASEQFSTTILKVIIIMWALIVIAVTLYIDNPWILAGILAWEVLP